MLLKEIVHEFTQLRRQKGRRAALDIFNLLNNNRQVFTGHIDANDLSMLIRNFEGLGDASYSYEQTGQFKEEYDRACGLLNFYLEKII